VIASFLHNYIFIKTKKTAGSTIEAALAPSCGPDDIITALPLREELERGNGTVLARNFLPSRELEAEYREAMKRRDRYRVLEILDQRRFRQHMPASEVRAGLPAEFWRAAFKFTVERHPYEKAVSLAYFKARKKMDSATESMESFIDRVVRKGGYENFPLYEIDGEVAVDELIRTENLDADLRRVGKRLGIPIPEQLARSKGSIRSDRRPAREILSEEQKRLIRHHCRREFELLGWEP
jgi:hypothetical protein